MVFLKRVVRQKSLISAAGRSGPRSITYCIGAGRACRLRATSHTCRRSPRRCLLIPAGAEIEQSIASAGSGETDRDGRSDAGSVMATVARRGLPGKMVDLVCPPPVSARHHPAHRLALSAFLRSAIATSTICSLSMDSMCPTKRRDGSLEVRASGETIEVTTTRRGASCLATISRAS
jgi:hypothetical protein